MDVIYESGLALAFTVTPDGPPSWAKRDFLTKNPLEPKRGFLTKVASGELAGRHVVNMAADEIGGPSTHELFTAEWGELVALYRLASSTGQSLADIRLRREARRQLEARMQLVGITLSLHALLRLDPLAAFDALAPKALLGPPPDPRFGPMVTAENAADLDATAARYRAEALRRGGADGSFLQRTDAAAYTKPSLA